MTTGRAIALIWLIAGIGGVVIAVVTRIGPVEVVLPGHLHGLHRGDLVGFVVVSLVAAAGTIWVRR